MFEDCSRTRGNACFDLMQTLEVAGVVVALLAVTLIVFRWLRKEWKSFIDYPFSKEECPWRGCLPGSFGESKYVLLYMIIFPTAMCFGMPTVSSPDLYYTKCYACGVKLCDATEETPHP